MLDQDNFTETFWEWQRISTHKVCINESVRDIWYDRSTFYASARSVKGQLKLILGL